MDTKTFILGVADAIDYKALSNSGVRLATLRATIAAYAKAGGVEVSDKTLDEIVDEIVNFFVSNNAARVRDGQLYAAYLDNNCQELN